MIVKIHRFWGIIMIEEYDIRIKNLERWSSDLKNLGKVLERCPDTEKKFGEARSIAEVLGKDFNQLLEIIKTETKDSSLNRIKEIPQYKYVTSGLPGMKGLSNLSEMLTILRLSISQLEDYLQVQLNEQIKTKRKLMIKELYLLNRGGEMGASKLQGILGFNFPPEGTPEMQKLIVSAGLADKIRVIHEENRTIVRFLEEDYDNGEIKMNRRPTTNQIFIIHGHDEEMVQAIARIIEQQNLEAIILRDKPNLGTRAIIDKFQNFSNYSTAAIVLFTPDDKGCLKNEFPEKAKFRVRQNVLIEFGYFIGKLGEKKVIPIFRKVENFEVPSDILGIGYIDYTKPDWKYKLVDELKEIGYNVSRNRIK